MTPERVETIIQQSDSVKQLQFSATQTAEGLSLVQTTTTDLGERVETLESGVHIGADGIGIYRSDYAYRMQMEGGRLGD